MMQLNSIKAVDYSLLVKANDGEEQIVISASAGQSGHCALHVVQLSCDGGLKVVADHQYGKLSTSTSVTHKCVSDALAEALTKIGFSGNDTHTICKRFEKNMGIE